MPILVPQAKLMRCALDFLNGELGKQFALAEVLPGKSSAQAVDAPDGERAILKVFDSSHYDTVKQTVHLVEHLRAAGYPTPRPLHHGLIPGGGSLYLQERLPGQPMRFPGVYNELNQQELELLLCLLDLHAGVALRGSLDWIDKVEEVALRQSGEWAVVAQSPLPAVQRLLEMCAKQCAGLGDPGWSHGDLVIGDFGPHNVLLNEKEQVTAVFDLEGAGRGDRVIDMMGLLYMVEPKLVHTVRNAALKIASPSALTICSVFWIVHRLYQGMQICDANVERAAQQMLAHVNLLI